MTSFHLDASPWFKIMMLALGFACFKMDCDAFSILSTHPTLPMPTSYSRPTAAYVSPLFQSQSDSVGDEEGPASSSTEEEPVQEEEDNDENNEDETPEEPKEDPEVTKIKEENAELEASLKSKREKIQYLQDSADDYSKAGYARKVAQMENMRRARSSMQSSNKYTATANTLREFLPTLDVLTSLKIEYTDDGIGTQYGALASSFKGVFTGLEAAEYTASPGEPIDERRMLIVDSEHSDDHPKNTVLRSVKLGMELNGNIIRLAECVECLGKEVEEEAVEEGADQVTESVEEKED